MIFNKSANYQIQIIKDENFNSGNQECNNNFIFLTIDYFLSTFLDYRSKDIKNILFRLEDMKEIEDK